MRDRRTPPPWREVRPGLLLVAGILALGSVTFFTDKILRSIQEGPVLTVSTPAAPELRAGSDVWVAGRLSGRVVAVSFRPPRPGRAGNLVIRAVLHREAAEYLRRDAVVEIRPADLLEPVVLAIDPGSPDEPPFDFADTLRTPPPAVGPERVLELLDSLRTTSARNAPLHRRLSEGLRAGRGTIAALHHDSVVLGRLMWARAQVRSLRANGGGSLGRLVTDSLMPSRLDSVMQRVARLAAARETLMARRAGDALDLGATLERLSSRIAAIDRRLSEGRGSAGRALYDDEILRQAQLIKARLDSVVSELAGNPFRWLRFKIF